MEQRAKSKGAREIRKRTERAMRERERETKRKTEKERERERSRPER